jgi:glucose-1-phosphate cytidylyltransferase
VVILCGGEGTRMREETEFRPKPMVMIGERPILWHIMKIYDHYEFRNFTLCLGYKAEMIRNYFLDYRMHTGSTRVALRSGKVEHLSEAFSVEDWTIALIDTGLDSLTGRRAKKALSYIDAERFMLTYGDGVADVDIAALLAHHRKSKRLATITAVRPSSRFGELGLEGDRVRSFQEKPQTGEGWINGGFMVFEAAALDVISNDANEPLETGVLEPLSKRGQLSVYRHDGFWQCMDTPREKQLLEAMWASRSAPWALWGRR